MKLTSQAKSRFSHDDLIERGQALIEESISFGVTHMRAFVEVDLDVGMKCLDAGLELKERFKERCYVQICVFAQNAIVSYEDAGKEMKALLEKAVGREGVEVLGSTPYVEKGGERKAQVENIRFTVEMALKYTLHVDFHIDYNLDARNHSMVFEALELLDSMNWPSKECSPDFRTIVFGHCTRLTLFDNKEWDRLRDNIGNLPVSFVGLPTSDLFMMGRPDSDLGGGVRPRGTLQIPQMIKKYGLNGAIGINNVGNAFTPQGNCDPLSLASLGVAVYQAGTKEDADILLNVKLFGLGMLAHALSALLVFSFGFRPFVNFYGCTFILYELSSPFLNFHWFFDKLDMTGSKPQLYNGIALLATFFSCRLVWGTYQSVRVYQDVWKAVHHQPLGNTIAIDALNNGTAAGYEAAHGKSAAPIHNSVMQFAGPEFVPLWLAFTYLGSNIVLNTLNFYWFGKMIETVRKRFQPPKEERRKAKMSASKSTGVNGTVKVDLDSTEVRRRNVEKDDTIEGVHA
ncbi:putative Uncharacterized TLC domain-containing protein C17A2.02c [Glarea lozoyensis 74030]|uniref:Putative Uncharacterized TLC domain-containing protein C17A2.02c n=1 Tax=Glarea lozoyensis (strain ATCC 74030 / MF5533) TaxID=1104152 RepID=H0ERR2_GLAL7|nr:putative Uncharacterized TLC domain-containing protein C17A2.02c [Glarea lozoyensis 74030]